MKDKVDSLKIYNFSHPLMFSEMLSLEGDKFAKALPFSWEYVTDLESAQVVVWDGVITPRNSSSVKKLVEAVGTTKVLLILGESKTLYVDHSIVSTVDLSKVKSVEVYGWSALPEEILFSFEKCREMLAHV